MRALGVSILLWMLCAQLPAQEQAAAEEGLQLLHRARRVTQVITYGTRVAMRNSGGQVRGKLTGSTKETIFIDDQPYPISDVLWIGRRSVGSMIKGAGIAMLGIGVGISGPALAAGGSDNGIVNGVLFSAAGGGIVGLSIAQFRNGRKYYLDSDWKVIVP